MVRYQKTVWSACRENSADRNERAQNPITANNGGPNYSNMDDAFCGRMRAAIAAGLESAPIGVVTTPGTKNPRYLATEQRPLISSRGGTDF
jgi:hypothetical protein